MLPAAALCQEFGDKSSFSTTMINDQLKLRIMCSAAKDDGMSDMAETLATTVTSVLPGYMQSFVLKGLEQALIVSPGEGYCAVFATRGEAYRPARDISAGSIYTSAVRDGKITAAETDSRACGFLDKTGVCWEEVESGTSELGGVIGCFEGRSENKLFSVVVGREDILTSVGITDTGQSEESCADRGLGLL